MIILEKWQKADPLYGMETHYITEREIEALIEGKRLYFDVNWEYAVVIKFKSQKKKIERENQKLVKENEHKDKLIDIANAGISNLQEENQKLNKIIDGIENYLKVGIAMNFNINNNKFSEQTVDNYNDVLNKLAELKKEVE